MRGFLHTLRLALVSTAVLALACKAQPSIEPSGVSLVPAATSEPVIEPAPAYLRGRVALPAGARLYARPAFTSASWELTLAEPPLSAAEAPPRSRAFRVIGVVRDPMLGDFVAVSNDLEAEDEDAPLGCGQPLAALGHLRLLLFVPMVYVAEVSGRRLSVEPMALDGGQTSLEVGAGARLGPPVDEGMPPPPADSRWRWIDADGVRALAPVPDDAVALAWDPGQIIESRPAGEALLRDAEGATMWLDDGGGSTVELTFRNTCGDLRRVVEDPSEVESLRQLALDVFYDQSPSSDPPPPIPADADFRIEANTPLRWPDGSLAGEVLEPWAVEVGIGQTWDNRRCFALLLGDELQPLDQPGLACVAPQALEPIDGTVGSFAVHDELELGGSVELSPAEPRTGAWTDAELREVFNRYHDSSAECLRPLLVTEEEVEAARWSLDLRIDDGGRVEAVAVTARGESSSAVEDCLEVEAFTWVFPPSEGELRVAVTLGPWAGALEDEGPGADAVEIGDDEDETGEDEARERGRVIIIRDEE